MRLRRPEVDEEEEDEDTGELEVVGNMCLGGSSSVLRSGHERFDDDYPLFEDSMSLKILGISDACLATPSSQDNDFSASPKMPDRNLIVKAFLKMTDALILFSVDEGQEIMNEAEEPTPTQKETDQQDDDGFQGMIRASRDQYEQLHPYMRTLASWEELCDAISKLNSYFPVVLRLPQQCRSCSPRRCLEAEPTLAPRARRREPARPILHAPPPLGNQPKLPPPWRWRSTHPSRADANPNCHHHVCSPMASTS